MGSEYIIPNKKNWGLDIDKETKVDNVTSVERHTRL